MKYAPVKWNWVASIDNRVDAAVIYCGQLNSTGSLDGRHIAMVQNIEDAPLIAAAPELYALALAIAEQQIDGVSRKEFIDNKAWELVKRIQGEEE